MINGLPPKSVLVEGVECSGKSTLIKKLRDDVIPWDCKFLAHQQGHQFERFMHEYLMNSRTIFNRGHFSEGVYSKLWGREPPFQPHELQVLNEYVRRNLVVVLCDADLDTLLQRYNERGYPQKADAQELRRIRELFQDVFQDIDCLRYNSTDTKALEAIADEIKKRVVNS